MERRKFIKNSAFASSLFFVPSFVRAFESIAREQLGFNRLVIIQLSGGNDGLNSVIPVNDDIYYRQRPTLAINKKDTLRLSDNLGLHNSLLPLKQLYDEGHLTIVNNVGYPNPNRSHFRATDIWQTASGSDQLFQSGWIGRYLDQNATYPYNAIEIDDNLSLTLKGESLNGIATKNADILFKTSQDPFFKKVINHYDDTHLNEHNLGYLYKSMIAAESSAKYIYEHSRTYNTKQEYPNSEFGQQLKTTAKFINSGLDTKVFYSSLDGFDTHVHQPYKQKRLLKDYAESVDAFVKDLKKQNTFKNTLILTFSEFGRRVKQNAANGTDHGAANNVFIIGENLKKQGLYNNLASLNDLDDNGDIKYEIDFRTIYATILNKWLEVDDERILKKAFNHLDFI